MQLSPPAATFRTVRYYRNGVLVYTSSVAPAFPLGLDTTLYTTNATIAAAAIRK